MGQIKQFAIRAEESGVDPGLALSFWKGETTADEAIQMAIDATPEEELEENLEAVSGRCYTELGL